MVVSESGQAGRQQRVGGAPGCSAVLIEDVAPSWPTCRSRKTRCGGIQVAPHRRCLAHLNKRELDTHLAALEPGSDVDFRGTTISEELLRALIEAVTDDRPHFGKALFDRATFDGSARFTQASFDDHASFLRARFTDEAIFQEAVFRDRSDFAKASFKGRVSFNDATFTRDAYFARRRSTKRHGSARSLLRAVHRSARRSAPTACTSAGRRSAQY
jgi:hypothetical protein